MISWTGSQIRMNNTSHFYSSRQTKWMVRWVSWTSSKVRMNNTNHFYSSRQTMNNHFIGFHQLVQKLEWITPIISTLHDKQNKCSLYRVSSAAPKSRMTNTNHFYFSRKTTARFHRPIQNISEKQLLFFHYSFYSSKCSSVISAWIMFIILQVFQASSILFLELIMLGVLLMYLEVSKVILVSFSSNAC